MEYLEFKTSGDWTVEEWNIFLSSVAKIYNIFLAIEIIKEFESNIPDPLENLTVSKVLNNQKELIRESARLKIHKIKMASPGIISFEGIGEPLKQARLFIEKIIHWKQNNNEIKANAKKIDAEAEKVIAEIESIRIDNELKKQSIISDTLENYKKAMILIKEQNLNNKICPSDSQLFCEEMSSAVLNLIKLRDNNKLVGIKFN